MFYKRRLERGRRCSGNQTAFESLEGRRLLCASSTTAPAATADTRSLEQAHVVSDSAHAEAAPEGHFKGLLTNLSGTIIDGVGQQTEIKIFVTDTSVYLLYGTQKLFSKLSPAHFEKLQRGTFNVTFSSLGRLAAPVFTATAAITHNGDRISGTISGQQISSNFYVTLYSV